ncbi:MAG: PleD family two-component system response regulator [Candidatus Paceibacterota bacterium]
MANELEGKKIVWVEDDNFLGGVITKKLSAENADVIYADTGAKALEALKETVPDIILLDVLLPDKDGFEVLEAVKNDERLKDVPVIMFSNLSQEENIIKARKMGALDFYVKSNLSPDQITENIKQALS